MKAPRRERYYHQTLTHRERARYEAGRLSDATKPARDVVVSVAAAVLSGWARLKAWARGVLVAVWTWVARMARPLPVDPEAWTAEADANVVAWGRDGRDQVLMMDEDEDE